MLLRLLLLVLAIPVILAVAGAILGFNLLSAGGGDSAEPSADPTPVSTSWTSPTTTDGATSTDSPTGSAGATSTAATSQASTFATAYPPARITGRESLAPAPARWSSSTAARRVLG
ncbi:hypothetical protein [Arsenicicoccus sp. oral taxon 190]|uniref:hypothetical protein n=1 Tax=Arsenicicoccus sp. oral taxon 190 TaxID=1658671 RepID=UPI00067A35CC|nr:hypothetical protein [Arsenicicoccus sp. oral taxon 190]AKT51321.1 hypothetical protein ADJ73_08285 [Arsenicicoccus sp. oral taxon 190]